MSDDRDAIDPYGQLRVTGEVFYARAQRLLDNGQARAGREVRWCARYVEERYGGCEPLPPQPTLQLPRLIESGEMWLAALKYFGANDLALMGMLQKLLADVERTRHKVKP